jgi:hypothetical protein
MSEHIVSVVNSLVGIESFLELGTGRGVHFAQIQCPNKVSVDINGEGTVTCTTDKYFAKLPASVRFDVIFIDANHDLDYVVRDYNNAIRHATQFVILHDMIPPTKMHTQSRYCSDSYKLLNHFIKLNRPFYSLNCDMGLTVLNEFEPVNRKEIKDIGYGQFTSIVSKVKTYSLQELIDICAQLRKEHG